MTPSLPCSPCASACPAASSTSSTQPAPGVSPLPSRITPSSAASSAYRFKYPPIAGYRARSACSTSARDGRRCPRDAKSRRTRTSGAYGVGVADGWAADVAERCCCCASDECDELEAATRPLGLRATVDEYEAEGGLTMCGPVELEAKKGTAGADARVRKAVGEEERRQRRPRARASRGAGRERRRTWLAARRRVGPVEEALEANLVEPELEDALGGKVGRAQEEDLGAQDLGVEAEEVRRVAAVVAAAKEDDVARREEEGEVRLDGVVGGLLLGPDVDHREGEPA